VPMFHAQYSADASNVTGDDTEYTLLPDTEEIDTSLFNTSTGTFTAPKEGWYYVNITCWIRGLLSGHNTGRIKIVATGSSYEKRIGNVGAMRDAGSDFTGELNHTSQMSAGDTFTVTVRVSSSTKVVDIEGDQVSNTRMSARWVRDL
jgi:hypothetical protein